MKNYRGVTLMDTSYKIYAGILNERLMEAAESGNLFYEGQAGFRKGRGTMDNIYILKRVADFEIYAKKGEIFACFVDLKAAFDKVNRRKLWKDLRKKGIEENLIKKIEEMYEETTCTVNVNGRETKAFRISLGLKQGCPLSPTLFSLYLADIEDALRKNQDGGIMIGKTKIWTLAYADDIVLLASDAQGLRNMMQRLERSFRRKELILNAEKIQVMRFRNNKVKRRKECWNWEGKVIEEVKSFKYLGYTLQENNDDDKHIKEVTTKGKIAMRSVWGIGERNFGNKWNLRWKIYEAVVRSRLLYMGWKYGDIKNRKK